MIYMRYRGRPKQGSRIRRGRWGKWEAKPLGSESFAGGFESHCGDTEGGAEKGGESAPEGVSDEPDSRGGIQRGEVVDEVLPSQSASNTYVSIRLCGT